MRSDATGPATTSRVSTGVVGLDDVLAGGLTANRLYVIEGMPGSGKTTLGLQFLIDGARRGESVLYVTLSETTEELRDVATSHGWDLDGIAIRELVPSQESLEPDDQYTMFHPSEVELGETTKTILEDVDHSKPRRVVFDSMSEFRLLAGNALRYRRQILALKQFFNGRCCTVLLLDDLTSASHDLQVQSIAHGVLRLEQLNPEYGAERRRLIVPKYRGVAFRGGYHDYVIREGGLEVFPRLIAREHSADPITEELGSGIPELDKMLGGGIDRGTSTLIVGAAGTGKSSLAMQFVGTAAARGEHAALFLFEEARKTLLARSSGLGIDLEAPLADGRVTLQRVDPAELSPGEFAHAIRRSVEEHHASIVVIDSLNGYLNAMPDERFLVIQLHELLSYLSHANVATLLIGAQQGVIGNQMSNAVDVSYLADAVILMRYYELQGELRKVISAVKKRGGAHERDIREFRLEPGRVSIGPSLREFRGVLTGVPFLEEASVARG